MTAQADIELLTLAARAVNKGAWHPLTHGKRWNPLRDHDQAKQLRHALHLSTGFDDRFISLGPCAYATYSTGLHTCNSVMQNIEQAGSKKAALRRAIVRAAAAMAELASEERS